MTEPAPKSVLKDYVDDSTVIAARFPNDVIKVLDQARNKLAGSGPLMARSALVKTALYWYLSYLGLDVPRPTLGGRRTTKQ